MSGMVTVARVELRLLTPTFVAGADQNRPELRASAIKSALRFWYRALNPHAVLAEMHKGPRKEDRIFGGSDENTGRSPVLFDVSCDANRAFSWADVDLDRFNVGAGKQRKNGLKYLIYSLLMQPNDERAGLPPGLRATLVMRAEKKELERLGEEGRRGWIAALWLFGNLGSLGTRSRRGLGSLKVTNWPPFEVDEWRKEAAALPSLAAVSTKEEWQARFGQGMNVLDAWAIG